MIISSCEPQRQNLISELNQMEEEGYSIPQEIRVRTEALAPDAAFSPEVAKIYEELSHIRESSSFDSTEPSDLEAIRALRPCGPRKFDLTLSQDDLLRKIRGAWTGRSVGCALGKPVEGWHKDKIKEELQKLSDWELKDFFSSKGPFGCPKSQRENIVSMEIDDDINYTIIGLKVFEQYGKDFKWYDVANTWNFLLPFTTTFTAERQALLTYNLFGQKATPEITRINCNPYREWIGAAIRADFWGYVAAGDPEKAALLAYRDACWTHTKNGIYGEMFIAAVIAAAFVESDILKLIEIGLSEIPCECRLAKAIRQSLEWWQSGVSWEEFLNKLYSTYDTMSRVHTINNLQIVVMALLYGDGTIDRNTALAVMGGMDTDCTAATVGSITGILNQESTLALRLNDTIESSINGEQRVTITDMAKRTLVQYNKTTQTQPQP